MADEILTAQETQEISVISVSDAIAEFGEGGGIFKKVAESLVTDGYYATFKTETMAERKRLLAATDGDVKLLRDYMGIEIQVADIVFEQTEVTDDDGTPLRTVGVIIIDPEDNAYKSTSNGVVKSAGKLIEKLGTPDMWDGEEVYIICKETTTARGRRYKYLDFK